MFDLLLTEDPSAWPWHAFLNLPLIPISLILSRAPLPSAVAPLVPILLAWPSSTPIRSREVTLVEQWRPNSSSTSELSSLRWNSWPPSPAFVGLIILPFARMFYKRAFARLTHWVLKTRPRRRPPVMRFMMALNAPFRIRFGADIREVPANRPGQGQQGAQGARLPNQLANQEGQQQQQQPDVNADEDAALALAADEVINVTGTSLGRLIGGALILPTISSYMGSFLFRLSMNSTLLRRFLAIRPGGHLPPALGAWSYSKNWNGLSPLRQIGVAAKLVFSVAWRGTRTWADSDPVWLVILRIYVHFSSL